MNQEIITQLDNATKRHDLPVFHPGDRVRVSVTIREAGKERTQMFEGDVIRIRGSNAGRTFTVRKISNGVGVERTFPVESPNVTALEVIRENKVRRAKLYFLRDLRGKAARLKERDRRSH
ncbi:MAG: 50S ribosomal protein L19 [Candidatus Schekmanbacteria bacterium]|nr:50S ribosomal protein L19 [Candidatus Schekmanbacteria bacterium]